MKILASLALSVALGVATFASVAPATAAEPATIAPAPVAATKYIVSVDGMT